MAEKRNVNDNAAGGWDPAVLAMFQRPAWSWQCQTCLTWITKKDVLACLSCEAVRKGYEKEYKRRQKERMKKGNGLVKEGKFVMTFGDNETQTAGMTALTFGGGDDNDAAIPATEGSNLFSKGDGSSDAPKSSSESRGFTFDIGSIGGNGGSSATTTQDSNFTLTFGDKDTNAGISTLELPKTPLGKKPAFGGFSIQTPDLNSSGTAATSASNDAGTFVLSFGEKVQEKAIIRCMETKCVLSPSLPRSRSGVVPKELSGEVYTWGSGDCDQLGHGKKDEGEEMLAKVPTLVNMRSCGIEGESLCAVSCGGLHTAALTSAGLVVSWGCNDDETLGRACDDHAARIKEFYRAFAPAKLESVPVVIEKYRGHYDTLYMRLFKKYGVFPGGESVPGFITLKNTSIRFVQVECGDCHTAALTNDGRVFTWGTYKDSNGYIGFDRTGLKKQAFPREVPSLFKHDGPMTQIACGSHHTCARSARGLLLSWGDAEHGQIGQKVPSRLKKEGLRVHTVGFRQLRLKKHERRVERVFCHSYCSFAVLKNGKTYAWYVRMLYEMFSLARVSRVALLPSPFIHAQHMQCLDLNNNNARARRGLNNYGQLGTGDKETRMTPTPVLEGHSVSQVRGGLHHSIAVTSKGHVFTCGRGDSGQLGIPEMSIVRGGNDTWTRVEAFDDDPIKVVASGTNHCLALSHSGSLYSWGFGEMYQLGHNVDKDEYVPRRVEVDANREVLWIAAGGQHSAMISRTTKS